MHHYHPDCIDVYVGQDGKPVYNKQLRDWNGEPVKSVHDEHITWSSKNFDPNTSHAIYCDRMWQSDGARYYAAVRTIWPESPQRQMFHGITPEQANMLLNMYFGKEVVLTAILQGTNHMNGYPYWVFGYMPAERTIHHTNTMRVVVNNIHKNSIDKISNTIEVLPLWQYSDYAEAQDFAISKAKNCVDILNANVAKDKFRLSVDDDIYNTVLNHEAVIFCDGVDEPIATFDVFGLDESTDKYGIKHWYYRGFACHQKPNATRVYAQRGETMFWHKDLDNVLRHIDDLLFQESIQKAGK